jgi:hypothetical protein
MVFNVVGVGLPHRHALRLSGVRPLQRIYRVKLARWAHLPWGSTGWEQAHAVNAVVIVPAHQCARVYGGGGGRHSGKTRKRQGGTHGKEEINERSRFYKDCGTEAMPWPVEMCVTPVNIATAISYLVLQEKQAKC